MESGSHTDNTPGRSPHTFADLVGTVIALLTLTIPVVTITHFSSAKAQSWQSPSYPMLQRLQD